MRISDWSSDVCSSDLHVWREEEKPESVLEKKEKGKEKEHTEEEKEREKPEPSSTRSVPKQKDESNARKEQNFIADKLETTLERCVSYMRILNERIGLGLSENEVKAYGVSLTKVAGAVYKGMRDAGVKIAGAWSQAEEYVITKAVTLVKDLYQARPFPLHNVNSVDDVTGCIGGLALLTLSTIG